MTMAQVGMLTEYWHDHPPVHILKAAQLGIKPSKRQASQSFAEFMGLDPSKRGKQTLNLSKTTIH